MTVVAGAERIEAGFLVACAGLESDRVARLAGLEPGVRIVPFRGDYCELTGAGKRLVRHLIYPVPDPELPFLGVHLTRRVDGAIEAGPNAVLAWRRDGYRGVFSLCGGLNGLGLRSLHSLGLRGLSRFGLGGLCGGLPLLFFCIGESRGAGQHQSTTNHGNQSSHFSGL